MNKHFDCSLIIAKSKKHKGRLLASIVENHYRGIPETCAQISLKTSLFILLTHSRSNFQAQSSAAFITDQNPSRSTQHDVPIYSLTYKRTFSILRLVKSKFLSFNNSPNLRKAKIMPVMPAFAIKDIPTHKKY